jgi:P-type Ca2+ transporter type 2C
VGRHIAIIGPVIGLLLLVMGYLQWQQLGLPNLLQIKDEAHRNALLADPKVLLWGTLMFTALALMQVGRAFSSRSFFEPFWKQPLRTNKVLVGMILAVVVLQTVRRLHAPGVQAFFSTTSLSALNLLLCGGFSVVVLVIMEALKALERRRRGIVPGIQ